MSIIIERRIYIEPKYLDTNLMEHLLKKIKEITTNECTKEYGHILSVNKLVEITGNIDTIFTVKFEATTLKPEPGKKFDAVVCMVYKDGIFVNIAGKQKMLIPVSNLVNYKFNEAENVYINTETKNKISIGNTISIQVTAAKYNNQNFSCVGSIV